MNGAEAIATIEKLGGQVRLCGGSIYIDGSENIKAIVSRYRRQIKAELLSRCKHVPPLWKLVYSPIDVRRGWLRYSCACCGKFLGNSPETGK